jgi:hypothetical protein
VVNIPVRILEVLRKIWALTETLCAFSQSRLGEFKDSTLKLGHERRTLSVMRVGQQKVDTSQIHVLVTGLEVVDKELCQKSSTP